MNKYLLLILLFSWALLVTNACDTGVAVAGHVLSVQQSLMDNADVALLKTYNASRLQSCMEDCCTGKFGACTIASFQKNTSQLNCRHFNCRPLSKCAFQSSNDTDTFTFDSSLLSTVPSSAATKERHSASVTTSLPLEHEVQVGADEDEQPFNLKNDNTTIKPRKGVLEPDSNPETNTRSGFKPENGIVEPHPETSVTRSGIKPRKGVVEPDSNPETNSTRSGIKPRKGVKLEDAPPDANDSGKSKVKPRKGVGPYSTMAVPNSPIIVSSSAFAISPTESKVMSNVNMSLIHENNGDVNDTDSKEFLASLEKVFEDEPLIKIPKFSPIVSTHSSKPELIYISPSSVYTTTKPTGLVTKSTISSTSAVNALPYTKPSYVWRYDYYDQSTLKTPAIESISSISISAIADTEKPSNLASSVITTKNSKESSVERTRSFSENQESHETNLHADSELESENDRKFKSSMHLILSLVFGLLVLCGVLGVVAKRIYDGWLRRHYHRMDFLIDGMYNGYE